MTLRLTLAALAATAAATSAVLVAPAADAALSSPHIVGGTKASVVWEVQLLFEQDGGTYGCTGEQLNASWVLTANHCADGTTAMDVYQSNSTSNRGPARAVDALYSAPDGDIALAHLASPAGLSSYAPLDLGFAAKSSGSGVVQGYGQRANATQSDGLYKATVSLTGRSTDAYYGDAQHVTGVDGASNHGDSGGALLVNGLVVGVCSTGDTADPGADTHAGSNYAVLSQSASWLRSTAGV